MINKMELIIEMMLNAYENEKVAIRVCAFLLHFPTNILDFAAKTGCLAETLKWLKSIIGKNPELAKIQN